MTGSITGKAVVIALVLISTTLIVLNFKQGGSLYNKLLLEDCLSAVF